ncbi:3'-5' exonuclease [Siphonobacter sp. SORGH_AS_0500]|uniref:3'-5' exonuclease n=1 Tax=Siphonobacter sp. SORGH_AS_0500 TaxID=1864824 RepID=UPI0028600852|nr:3'-5' exonuclease [Siphonobacter sp. SORGH_AS_0500]MDR6193406.1 putative PolB exonuclease-like 3'-5' exonuclease [Siphonobacter sp. SORGH_AS_0500]
MSPLEFRAFTKQLLFIDIETVAGKADFTELPERLQKEWIRKAGRLKNDEERTEAELYPERAAIYAEFGKIIVIGLGFFHWDENDELTFRVRTFHGHEEAEVLQQFCDLIEKRYSPKLTLCAHNGREFDYPYLCRRLMVQGLKIPKPLWNPNWKRYDTPHLDTMELWKFGDYKNFTSLELLAALFEIPSSKENLSGDQVNATYYQQNDLTAIAEYCREDVVVLAQLYLRFNRFPLLPEEQIFRLA